MKQISTREIESYLQKYIACMQAHGEELMDKPMPAAEEELFALYETTGNRLKYESVYLQDVRCWRSTGAFHFWRESLNI